VKKTPKKPTTKKRKAPAGPVSGRAPEGGEGFGLSGGQWLAQLARRREEERASPALWLKARRRSHLALLEAGCYRPRTEATEAEGRRIAKLKPKAARKSLLVTNAALETALTAEERADCTAIVTAAEALLSDPADAVAWIALAEALGRMKFAFCMRWWMGPRAVAGQAEALGLYREVFWPERQTAERRVEWSDREIVDRLATMREKHGRTAKAATETARALKMSPASVYRAVERERDAGRVPVT
jgi:hypothetical protein